MKQDDEKKPMTWSRYSWPDDYDSGEWAKRFRKLENQECFMCRRGAELIESDNIDGKYANIFSHMIRCVEQGEWLEAWNRGDKRYPVMTGASGG